MTRDDWARLEQLFHDAQQQPKASLDAWLWGACDDPSLRSLVGEMLAAYDADPEFLETPTGVDTVASAVSDAMVGQHLGPYLVTGQLGRGGMGVVFDAIRDDAEFSRRVAIKVLPAWSGASLLERFRLERRVLATLDHAGIAGLLDSGTTRDGAPYFVMEFVDGRPIDAWCREQRLDVRARVALVERVCAAVAYAHQRLVVHRDIKPANILVTADGQPKLLDFGIATLLAEPDGTDAGLTRTGQQSFTLDFASPEQIAGAPVTTATDVYSLGLLLYTLLTGRRAHELQGLSPLDAMRTACEVDPPAPSTAAERADAAAIRGDLDASVGKALRKDPTDRYPTVSALAADLHAWRAGLPVTAAPESMARRVRRFVRRNKAAAAVLAAVVVGAGVAAWQARVAAGERDTAQNRSRQMREFSRSLIFDVNTELAKVPGNTEARRLVLDRAVQLLDGLATDTEGDEALALELVEGYRRLARVQGDGQDRNVGDGRAAAESLDKAIRLAEALLSRRPDDSQLIDATLGALDEQRRARAGLGDDALVQRIAARHLELVERLARTGAKDPRAIALAAEGYSDAGLAKANVRDLDGARPLYERSVALFESLPAEELKGPRLARYAFALKRLGAVLLVMGHLDESERSYRAAVSIEEDQLRAAPGDASTEYSLTLSLGDLGEVLARQERGDEAATLWNRALAIRRRAAEADPKDTRAWRGVAVMLHRIASATKERGGHREAVAAFREALAIQDRMIGIQGPLPAPVTERAWASLSLAEALLAHADAEPKEREADSWRAEAGRLLQGLRPTDVTRSVTMGDPPEFGPRLDAARRALRHVKR